MAPLEAMGQIGGNKTAREESGDQSEAPIIQASTWPTNTDRRRAQRAEAASEVIKAGSTSMQNVTKPAGGGPR